VNESFAFLIFTVNNYILIFTTSQTTQQNLKEKLFSFPVLLNSDLQINQLIRVLFILFLNTTTAILAAAKIFLARFFDVKRTQQRFLEQT
jgi:hypothetical protein